MAKKLNEAQIKRAADLRVWISECEDTISCLEADIANGDPQAEAEIDDVHVRLHDLKQELKELEHGH